jgi:hypothetical protein
MAAMYAYLIKSQSIDNVFTVGDISMELTEPNYPGNDSDDPVPITPNETVKKDPTVTNTGSTNEYVFIKVENPYVTANVVNSDGSSVTNQKVELFNYTLNSGWVEVGNPTFGTEASGTITHIYAYAGTVDGKTTMTALAGKVGSTTSSATVFDTVTAANIAEGDNFDQAHLKVTAYGIQTTGLASTAPADVWTAVDTQVQAEQQSS